MSSQPSLLISWYNPSPFYCLLRAVSQSMSMQWQRLMSMSTAHITTRNHKDIPDLGNYLGPHGCPVAVQNCPSLDAVRWKSGLTSYLQLQHWKECGPCTSPGQQSGACPGDGDKHELAKEQEHRSADPSPPLPWRYK